MNWKNRLVTVMVFFSESMLLLKNSISACDFKFGIIYVNGSNNLPNESRMKKPGKSALSKKNS